MTPLGWLGRKTSTQTSTIVESCIVWKKNFKRVYRAVFYGLRFLGGQISLHTILLPFGKTSNRTAPLASLNTAAITLPVQDRIVNFLGLEEPG